MTEQQIQAKRIKELEADGYFVLKLIRTNKNGIPDLLAIPKDSDVLFCEVKRPDGKLSKLQQYRIKELNQHGITTEVYRGADKESGGQSKTGGGERNDGEHTQQRQGKKQRGV
jgi:hypothetical protein